MNQAKPLKQTTIRSSAMKHSTLYALVSPRWYIAEYQIQLTLIYQIKPAHQDPITRDIKIRRQYLHDAKAALAKKAKSVNLFKTEMYQQATLQITQEIMAYSTQLPTNG